VRRSVIAAALIACASAACGPNHITAFTPKEREYKAGKYAQRDPSLQPSRGSLFSDASGGFLEDTRAVRVGDIVLINIDESADATGNSTTALSRNSTADMGITNVLGLVGAIKASAPMFDPSTLLSWMSSADFAGQGNTARKGELRGRIAVRITREMPNGDLFIEGTKVILINYEEYHLYVSGLVRRADIAEDNTVLSSRIADAEVEFTGRGDIDDQQRKGVLGRALDKVQPF
jgi:flagellar L-ring protein FlgH